MGAHNVGRLAGVGERFFMLFDISENIAAAPQSSYILFGAAQFDTYAYLFDPELESVPVFNAQGFHTSVNLNAGRFAFSHQHGHDLLGRLPAE